MMNFIEMKLNALSSEFKEIIDGILDNKIGLFDKLHVVEKIIIEKYQYHFECDEYYDLILYEKLMFGMINGSYSLDHVRIELQEWEYNTNYDKTNVAYDAIMKHEKFFNRVLISSLNMLVYLDLNVFSDCIKNESIFCFFKCVNKNKYQYVYSPAHIEEINKIISDEERGKFFYFFESITGNYCLQPKYYDRIALYMEEPKYIMDRVNIDSHASHLAENNKLLKKRDRELFFSDTFDRAYMASLGEKVNIFIDMSDAEFNRLMVVVGGMFTQKKSDFFGLKSHSEIRRSIFALHDALDLIGYKVDSNERTRRSSRHDVEHLIYGSQCKYFVTKDSKLFFRAIEIYSFMGLDVNVISMHDFINRNS